MLIYITGTFMILINYLIDARALEKIKLMKMLLIQRKTQQGHLTCIMA
jgi:hypothetical protein